MEKQIEIMTYILTIPKPCTENWNSMTPIQKGGFCDKCKKEVLDFTYTSNFNLSRRLDAKAPICGRFKTSQLNQPIRSVTQHTWKRNAALLGFTSLLTFAAPMMAQQKQSPIAQQLEQKPACSTVTIQKSEKGYVTINGHIEDPDMPLPGVKIALLHSSISTQTDFDGDFSITLPKIYLEASCTLVISSLGYETKEATIDKNTQFLSIKFEEADAWVMGEVVIISKRNIFRRISNLFKRK